MVTRKKTTRKRTAAVKRKPSPPRKKSDAPDHIVEWAKNYRKIRPICEEFTYKLRQLVFEILRGRGVEPTQIESRTKTVESFVEKARRESKHYNEPAKEITDLVGLRIIAYDREDVETIAELVANEFDVDWENSDNKADTLALDRFGYLSIHFVVSLNKQRCRLIEWKSFCGLKAEIQIRTVLQHAWAVIDHKFRYKTTQEIPTHLRRRLFRLSALLELADEEFLNLKRLKLKAQENYIEQVREGELDIEINMTSLEAYFASTGEHLYWAKVARKIGFKTYTPSESMLEEVQEMTRRRLLQILSAVGIETLGQMAQTLKISPRDGKTVLERVLEACLARDVVPMDIPYVVVGILILYGHRQQLTRALLRRVLKKSPLLKPMELALFPKD